jgi:tRNA (guanine-N7-)-methyltransferase
VSAQDSVHERLGALVARHARREYKKPVMPYNRAALETSMEAWKHSGHAPLILDAGCGVGLSTRHLASLYPDHFVVGIDQSAARLSRNVGWQGTPPANFICVRANLIDYWRLLLEAAVRPARHFILYPNPWPKIGHLSRRWHGHPVFPAIVALGGELECRSNWRIYIEEFAAAVRQLSAADVVSTSFPAAHPITPFEKKYKDSGHQLWRCTASLPSKGFPLNNCRTEKYFFS